MANRSFYSDTIDDFLNKSADQILGVLTRASIAVEAPQREAWLAQISFLRSCLAEFEGRGKVYFEYVVPRLGRRIDVLLLLDHTLFILEFKVGEATFSRSATEQVWDYALDLKNFHETSHQAPIAPMLIATSAFNVLTALRMTSHGDGVLAPVHVSPDRLREAILAVLSFCSGSKLSSVRWEEGSYKPTPTIVEAASALYSRHSVEEISRADASAKNLTVTSSAITSIIRVAREQSRKVICFVTGVPGAGKTLVGLNVATEHMDARSELHSVYLSGNGPLVAILQEALTRDEVRRVVAAGGKITKGDARRPIEAFIQNVHHFRDDCLRDEAAPPEHVAIFDEAQRAWTTEQTSAFMARKKGRTGFNQSEPEFLISCMDRHQDWAVIVCLVGGGQEINTGEAGIGEWLRSVERSFPHWQVFISPQLVGGEYSGEEALQGLHERSMVSFEKDLHLSVSMRSFRAESVSEFVRSVLDLETESAQKLFQRLGSNYPIVLTRSAERAKQWVKEMARGSERYGMMVSSQALRLKPHAIDVRVPVNPIHWFLNGKEDVRSSFYLEDVATEFHVQGLEVDWGCVVWDGDFRHSAQGWRQFSFVGTRWQNINMSERQSYLKNAYRVLLTRSRRGMVIVVPEGDDQDQTRRKQFYDPTYEYLRAIGLAEI